MNAQTIGAIAAAAVAIITAVTALIRQVQHARQPGHGTTIKR